MATAQTADQAWLKYRPMSNPRSVPTRVVALGNSQLEKTAAAELLRGLKAMYGNALLTDNPDAPSIVLGTYSEFRKHFPQWRQGGHEAPEPLVESRPFRAYTPPSDIIPLKALRQVDPTATKFAVYRDKKLGPGSIFIEAPWDGGVLYGTFTLLRVLTSEKGLPKGGIHETPALNIRWVDEWDNPDGSVERGYAGRSIVFEGGNVREDLAPVTEYARLLASVGINGCNINNVNAAPQLLDGDHLKQIARIADAMRPWGIRVALSVDIASPQKIGGLPTYDPLDPAVKAWWTAKVSEIYALIPDFAGFTVKADSEGQPGPSSFGRTPAEAANTLAAALEPHGGIVLYRAFVYNHHLDWRDPNADRARAAYDIFHPLDGKFAPNVVIQTKEGPIDFQAREPVSPLFGGLEHTSQAIEVQVTQEYTGQQRHLVYLAPMWKQVLDTDLRNGGKSTPVRKIVAGKKFERSIGGMVAVAGVGRDAWLGSPLALANLYAFGRLAWDPTLSPEQIAEEWTQQTISADPDVVRTVTKMLMESWPAYENYTGPLGMQTLTDITGSHYGPNIESSENNGWGQWHRADKDGVGMDRTVATGTGYTAQYPPEVARMYESLATCPDDLLLFFHHVPYTYRLHSGKTVIQHIYDSHYEGAAQAAQFASDWKTLEGRIDQTLYERVRDRLEYQAGHAIVWRDAVVRYFLKLSGIPDGKGRAGQYPGRMEAEDARLTGYRIVDVNPWEDASGGKAVACEGATSVVPKTAQKTSRASAPEDSISCTAMWTYSGAPGRFNIAVQYFDLDGSVARFRLEVNGKSADSWAADATLPSDKPNGDNSTRHTSKSVELKPGDILSVVGVPDKDDPAALDYVEVTPSLAGQHNP
jgi:alpha-glucuronidase